MLSMFHDFEKGLVLIVTARLAFQQDLRRIGELEKGLAGFAIYSWHLRLDASKAQDPV